MHDQNFMNALWRKIATETDPSMVRELNALLRAVFLDEVQEAKFRVAFLAETYGIKFDCTVTDHS